MARWKKRKRVCEMKLARLFGLWAKQCGFGSEMER